MSELLPQLIVTAVLGALSPVPILIVVTLLMSPRGLSKAAAFGGALTGVFAVIGVVVLATASTDVGASESGNAVTGTIIAVLGGVLLILAAKQIVGEPDPDAAPPKFMAKLDSMSGTGAAVLGALIGVVNIKQLAIYVAGLSQIVHADVSAAQGWLALAILVVVIQVGVLLPIVAFVVARDGTTRILGRFRAWLVANNHTISIVVGLVVGVAFLWKGIAQIV